jgi:hypothetical protein
LLTGRAKRVERQAGAGMHDQDKPPRIRAFRHEQAEMRKEFVRRVRQDLHRELRFSRRYASEGWRALGTVKPPQERGITLALTSQSLRDFDAVILLACNGSADQALMLWRPMFEKMLVALWALRHPELASTRFENQHRHTCLMANRIAKEMPELAYGQVPFPEAEAGEEETLNREFGRWGEKGVTGRNVAQLVEDVACTLDESSADDLRHCHRTAYFQSNDVLHTTSHAFGSTHGPLLESIAGEPSASTDGRQVLRYGWWTLTCMFRAVSDVFDEDCWTSLAGLESEGAQLFGAAIAEQMKRLDGAANCLFEIDEFIDYANANRTRFANTAVDEQCPCGSGKTYGECHHPIDSALMQFADRPKFGDTMLLRAPPGFW